MFSRELKRALSDTLWYKREQQLTQRGSRKFVPPESPSKAAIMAMSLRVS